MYLPIVKHFTAQVLIMALLVATLTNVAFAQKSISETSGEMTMTTPCQNVKVSTIGNSASTGTAGNIRAYGVGLVDLKASAFSKNATWQTAFLGAFSPGLGVTNSTENGSGGSHKVDNIGDRKDYVLFEFDQDVVIDQIYLDSVDTDDSDVTVWIGSGTDPYNNHLTLSDALLTSFGPSETNNGASAARWADINAAGKAGNVLVVAAAVGGTNDAFKIHEIAFDCASANRATVTIIKQVFPFGGGTSATQVFGYTATGLGTASFGLVDMNVTGPDRFINANITAFGPSNPITVIESLTGSWTLSDLLCVETGGISNSTVNFAQRKATIIAEAGESIVCTYKNTQLVPSAAHVNVSGRALTVDGQGIYGASLVLTDVISGETRFARTNPFGYYSFEDLEVGQFYVITIDHKRYTFGVNTRSFTLVDELTSVDFVEAF